MIAKTKLFGLIILLFSICLVSCSQQSNDITITTNSEQARELYIEGIEKHDYFYIDEARALFGQAVELDPDFAMAYYYWAMCSQSTDEHLNRIQKAASLVDKVSEAEQLIILSRKAQLDDSLGKAQDLLERLVQLKPASKRAHYLLGNFYYQQRDWDLAEKHLKDAIELDPGFAPPYNMLGYLYANTERYTEAIDALKKYSDLRPKEPNPHDSMGEIFLAMRDYDNSIKEYKKALKLESDFIYSRIGIGHNYVFMGDYDKARQEYEEVMRMANGREDTASAAMWITVSYLHEGEYKKAMELLDTSRAFTRRTADIYGQGMIYWEIAYLQAFLGNLQESMQNIAKLREIADRPDIRPGVKENFIRECLSLETIILTRLGRRDEANRRLSEYKESAEQSGSRVTMMHFTGLEGAVAFWNKDYETAIDKLLNSIL